ncbi:TetR/AcrR family transcriptional regulator [Leptospira andrefontaineae]|uniref:TetR/AcrR family transcriptional regulator n=1 Tax=Leptospira andrefontaineae TaxID=2484976 RepID=A0A4R9GXK4_9LEPT|nr:TetR/AcrR family transcriptional regulator [Leptospira andrefontaineae]TGK36647.1 TetR/AcrR family transcriptional regulator [Leptospira andrefontaineae]
MTNRQKSKPAPGRPPFPVDRIVSTALQIVNEEGAEALSMRSLADRLESGTATLYRHFSNRANLIAQVVDCIFGELKWKPEKLTGLNWEEMCRAFALNAFETLSRYPNAAPLLVENLPLGPNAMIIRESVISLFLSNEFSPHLAALSYASLSRYILGFAVQLKGSDQKKNKNDSNTFRKLNSANFPATVKVAEFLPVPIEKEFKFGLDLLIDGIRQIRDKEKSLKKR